MLFPAGCGSGVRVPEGYSLTPEMEALLKQYPAPGRFVDIGGYSLNMTSLGKSGPTVVMEAGAGSFSLVWAQVAPQLATGARVITYDRAGLGWSDPSPKARTADNIVAEFRAMLQKAGVKPPYVLVGHSMGAIYMRMYANKFPGEVSGMVLVDPGDENLPIAAGPEVAKDIEESAKAGAAYSRQQGRKCADGSFAVKLSSLPLSNQLPEEAARQLQALQATEPWLWSTIADEALGATTSWAQARAMNIKSVGNIPLIVLVSDQLVELVTNVSANQEANTTWRELQLKQVSESPQGEFEIARNSGHVIQLDQPDMVINAVNKVIRLAR
ncbi:MAG: alpha/beta fold hydrolase [Candidatus Geothermincolia bacterium]